MSEERRYFRGSTDGKKPRNTDPLANARRSLRRAVRVWPLCSPVQKKLVLAWMLTLDERAEVASEADGRGLLQLAESAPQFGEEEMVLCELAASAPGDSVWRECVDVVARRQCARQLADGATDARPR